jgi:hypothetical protein
MYAINKNWPGSRFGNAYPAFDTYGYAFFPYRDAFYDDDLAYLPFIESMGVSTFDSNQLFVIIVVVMIIVVFVVVIGI